MTYPAELDFKRDRTLPRAARRVYEYLSTELDFTQVRSVKSKLHSEQCGIGKPRFIAGLNVLVTLGYLVEHDRGANGQRHFTLAWSRNAMAAVD